MTAIIFPSRWARIARSRPQLNAAHPLAQHLVLAAVPHGKGAYDAVTGQLATWSASSGAAEGFKNRGGGAFEVSNDAATGFLTFPTQSLLFDRFSGSVSIFAECRLTANALNTQYLVQTGENSNGFGCTLAVDDSGFETNGIVLGLNNSVTFAPTTWDMLGTNSEQRLERAMVTADGTNAVFFGSGRQWEQIAAAASVTAATTRFTRLMGRRNAASNVGQRCAFSVILAWNSVLREGEYRALYENPWQLFKPDRSLVHSYPAAGTALLTVQDAFHWQTSSDPFYVPADPPAMKLYNRLRPI